MYNNFSNKYLKKCKWSFDYKKRINQINHFLDNNNKYDISINEMIMLSENKKELRKKLKKR